MKLWKFPKSFFHGVRTCTLVCVYGTWAVGPKLMMRTWLSRADRHPTDRDREHMFAHGWFVYSTKEGPCPRFADATYDMYTVNAIWKPTLIIFSFSMRGSKDERGTSLFDLQYFCWWGGVITKGRACPSCIPYPPHSLDAPYSTWVHVGSGWSAASCRDVLLHVCGPRSSVRHAINDAASPFPTSLCVHLP